MNVNVTGDSAPRAEESTLGAAGRAGHLTAKDLPIYLKAASVLLRSTFLLALIVVAARVSAPQAPGTSWFDMPAGDMARVTIGLIFCLCMARQAIRFPPDAGAYRTWLYLGLALAPLSAVCLFAVW
jgi:hypothetical protein